MYDPVLGGRIFYLSARTFAEMSRLLGETISREAAHALLWNIGQRYGLSLGGKVKRMTSNNDEAIKLLTATGLKSGWGKPRISDKLDTDNMIELIMENCVFCEGLASMGGSQCYFLAGILNGIAESLLGKRFQTRETECRASGGTGCRFIIESVQE